MNKTFQVINRKTGKLEWVVVRQIKGLDKIYTFGNIVPGYGKVIGIKPS